MARRVGHIRIVKEGLDIRSLRYRGVSVNHGNSVAVGASGTAHYRA